MLRLIFSVILYAAVDFTFPSLRTGESKNETGSNDVQEIRQLSGRRGCPVLRDYGALDFTPGAFFAAGVFSPQGEVESLSALVAFEREAERRRSVERTVQELRPVDGRLVWAANFFNRAANFFDWAVGLVDFGFTISMFPSRVERCLRSRPGAAAASGFVQRPGLGIEETPPPAQRQATASGTVKWRGVSTCGYAARCAVVERREK